jgi:hypothetical protein
MSQRDWRERNQKQMASVEIDPVMTGGRGGQIIRGMFTLPLPYRSAAGTRREHKEDKIEMDLHCEGAIMYI